jgi:Ca2+-binding RTX toxin-like protein
MIGGAGNDLYSVDSAGDVVSETSTLAGEIDTVNASVGFVLGARLENLTLTGSGSNSGTGNELGNKITGNAGANLLAGEGGNDSLLGSTGNDTLQGGEGNDTLNGGTGNDSMAGGAGNDRYVVDAPGDLVAETTTGAAEIDSVSASVSFTLPDNVEDLVLTGSEPIFGVGNGLRNKLTGNGAQNILAGEAGNDTVDGGAGNDSVQGGSGNDSLLGSSGNDTLDGSDGDDTLDGGTGTDALAGGAGNDRYRVDAIGDTVTEAGTGAAEIDTVEATFSFTLGANLEGLLLLGGASLSGTGNALANLIESGAGNDTLDGGAGNDTLRGGAGNDRYVLDSFGDVVVEDAGAGIDTVFSLVNTYTLPDHVDDLEFNDDQGVSGQGNALDNRITSGAGDDVLDGGAGNDTLVGGFGNDNYAVDSVGDTVIENRADSGSDAVFSPVSWILGDGFESLSLEGGSAGLNGTGNELDNSIGGNDGANMLSGLAGDDLLFGGGGNDSLEGGAGNDLLGGGPGIDSLVGGVGDDEYQVDSAADIIVEAASEGTDTVRSQASSWTLGDHLENLSFGGSGAFNGVGNGLANRITGGSGNDTLSGGGGNDTLVGGLGNDVYDVDGGDVITESPNQGTDTVRSSVISLDLANADVENGVLLGQLGLAAKGNALANTLTGNSGANLLQGLDGHDSLAGGTGNDKLEGHAGNDVLDGGSGNDTLSGQAGNDFYLVDAVNDVLSEASGPDVDTVSARVSWTLGSNFETLLLDGANALNGTGNTLANVIDGNEAANVLSGLDGNDTLLGDAGNDTLVGGAGSDKLNGGADIDNIVLDSRIGSDLVEGFGSGVDNIAIDMSAIPVGDRDTLVEGVLTRNAPGGWGAANELVVFTANAAGLSTANAAAAIGSSSSVLAAGASKIFVIDNGASSGVFLFVSGAADATVLASELTLLATISGTAATSASLDYIFVA